MGGDAASAPLEYARCDGDSQLKTLFRRSGEGPHSFFGQVPVSGGLP